MQTCDSVEHCEGKPWSKYSLSSFRVLIPAGNETSFTAISTTDSVSIHPNTTLVNEAECLFLGFTLPTLLTP